MYFAQCSFAEMKSKFIKLQNEFSSKDLGQELLIRVLRVPFSSSPRVSDVKFMKWRRELSPVTLNDHNF